MRRLLPLYFFILTLPMLAQNDVRPVDLVARASSESVLLQVDPFSRVSQSEMRTLESEVISKVGDYAELELNPMALQSIQRSSSEYLEFNLPIPNNEALPLQLAEVEIYEGDYVYLEPGNRKVKVNVGKHYRGIIKGKPNSMVAISFYDNQVYGLLSGVPNYSNLVIGQLENSTRHVVYDDRKVAQTLGGSGCGTKNDGVQYKTEELRYTSNVNQRLAQKCVRLYVEVDYDIYNKKGGMQGSSQWVTAQMNHVMTIYANEQIQTKLMPLKIWDRYSPYSNASSSGMLRSFQSTRSSWDGDLAQLLSFKASGGIAAGFSGICNSDRRKSMAFSSLGSSYRDFPSYSWNVDVITHEFGHIFGSRHTHACVWNGNGTAIDGCSGTEGSCSNPGYPSGGGTIMSYCHLKSVGKDLSKGFGKQPGDVIRNRVANGSCLQTCGGTDPTDPNPPSGCNEASGNVTLSITFDSYPAETTWELKNKSGQVVDSVTSYSNALANKTVSKVLTITTEGEYTFTIKDNSRDGICCNFGNGSYTLKDKNGKTLKAGSKFSSSESTTFCIKGAVAPPSDSQAPSAPTSLSASNVQTTSVGLMWNASTDNKAVKGYDLYLNGAKLGTTTEVSTKLSSLKPDTLYSAYVIAFDEAGNRSQKSNVIQFTTLSDAASPVGLRSEDETSNSVKLVWSGDDSSIQYNIYINGVKFAISSQATKVIEGLRPQTTYQAFVKGQSATGKESEASNTISFTTLSNGPTKPTNLELVSFADVSAQFKWTASTSPSGIAKYDIYINGSKLSTSTTTEGSVAGLRANTKYYAFVRAIDNDGKESDASNVVQFTTKEGGKDTEAPSVPTDMKASNVTTNSATLSWGRSKDNVGVAGYKVYLDGQYLETVTSNQFTSSSLKPATEYKGFVTAIDAAGNESGRSEIVSFTTLKDGGGGSDTEPPTSPTALVASDITKSSAQLSWNASSDNTAVAGYNIYINGNKIASSATTQYSLSGLKAGVLYKVYVTALDAAGNESRPSNIVDVKTKIDSNDAEPPTAPENLKSSVLQPTSVNISWDAARDNVGVVGYNIYVNGTRISSSTTTSKQLNGLKENATYNVYVTALDAAGNESKQSNIVTFTTPKQGGGGSDSTPPSAPENLVATDVQSSSLTLKWDISTDNVGVVGYNIYINGTKLSSSTTNSKSLNGLREGVTYNFYVKAIDAAGNESKQSNIVRVVMPKPGDADTQAPTPPRNLIASNIQNTSADLIWGAASDNKAVVSYKIYVNGVAAFTATSTSYSLKGLKEGTTYSIYVTALDAAGNESQPSNIVSVKTTGDTAPTPDTTPPSVPLNLQVSNVSSVSADLTWSASSDNVGVIKYEIYLSNTKKGETISTATSLSLLTPSTSYTAYVVAVDAAGNKSGSSNLVSFTTLAGGPSGGGDTIPPSTPLNLTYSNTQATSVDLSWTASTDNVGVVGYKIYEDGAYATVTALTSIKLTNLEPGKRFTFKVSAIDAAGNESEQSNFVTVNTPASGADTVKPTQPVSLAVSNVTATAANLNWLPSTDNVGVVGYKVYVDNKLISTETTTSKALSGLTSGQHSAYVAALDAAGNESEPSNTVYFDTNNPGGGGGGGTGGDTIPPSQPTNLSVSNVLSSSANLTWTASTDNKGLAGYKVYVNGVHKATSQGASTVISSLTSNTNYSVYVVAVDSSGNSSANSNTVTFKTKVGNNTGDVTPPSKPNSLRVVNIDVLAADALWDASTDNIGVVAYNVYLDGKYFGTSTGKIFGLVGLRPNTEYKVMVSALDAAGNESAKSDEVTFKTLTEGPRYCEVKGSTDGTDFISEMYFNNVRNNSGYIKPYMDYTVNEVNLPYGLSTMSVRGKSDSFWPRAKYIRAWIDYNQDGVFGDDEKVLDGSRLYFSLTSFFTVPASAKPGKTRLRVALKQGSAPSSCGDLGSGEVEDYTVIIGAKSNTREVDSDILDDQNRVSKTFDMYPNPSASGRVIIGLSETDNSEITPKYQVVTSSGDVVTSGEVLNREQVIDLSGIPKGLYLLNIVQDGESISKKLIIQ